MKRPTVTSDAPWGLHSGWEAMEIQEKMLTLLARKEIEDLLYKYARLVDEQRYHDWIDLFTEDGSYSAITVENLNQQGLFLFKDDGKEALKERVAYLMGYWQVPRSQTLHLVSNLEVNHLEENEVECRSCYHIYRIGEDGVPQFYSCGVYEDLLVKLNGSWRFRRRKVIVYNNTLPPNFTELL
jgi:3-phenylpropionate/cinnamic acid dioxygenase small subunit